MPRKTPQELQEARKAAKTKREEEAAAHEAYEKRLVQAYERHKRLVNVTDGLYDEVDKLARKWPSMAATDRTVARINKCLAAIRQLFAGEDDDFIDGLEEIVPAGDPPEYRDLVMILREAKDALARFETTYSEAWQELDDE